jgi:hypothetical protein
MRPKRMTLLLLVLIFSSSSLYAQMERERAVQDGPVEDIFLSGSIAGLSTVEALPAKNLNSMVMHGFGLFSTGIENFFGIDGGASVRLGIDYGLTDRWDIGIGRSGLENTIDFRSKYVLLHQLKSDRVPIQISLKGDIGITTQKERRFDYSFTERLNYLGSIMIARKFNEHFSLQLSPMVAHFNTIILEDGITAPNHTTFGVGISGRYKLNNRKAFAFEYLPVLGERNPGTINHLAFVYEIDTGGHVFQLFMMTGQWFTEQHLLTRTDTNILDREFRFGFNINRFFGLGK